MNGAIDSFCKGSRRSEYVTIFKDRKVRNIYLREQAVTINYTTLLLLGALPTMATSNVFNYRNL